MNTKHSQFQWSFKRIGNYTRYVHHRFSLNKTDYSVSKETYYSKDQINLLYVCIKTLELFILHDKAIPTLIK